MYYLIRLIITWFNLRKYSKILNNAYDSDQLVLKISLALGTQFKRASFGRLYAVLNPYIKDGKYSPEQIMEINESGAEDTTQWMTKWTFERLNIIRDFITVQNLLDVLTFEMSPLGDSNYLFIIKPPVFDVFVKHLKGFIIEFLIEFSIALLIVLLIVFL